MYVYLVFYSPFSWKMKRKRKREGSKARAGIGEYIFYTAFDYFHKKKKNLLFKLRRGNILYIICWSKTSFLFLIFPRILWSPTKINCSIAIELKILSPLKFETFQLIDRRAVGWKTKTKNHDLIQKKKTYWFVFPCWSDFLRKKDILFDKVEESRGALSCFIFQQPSYSAKSYISSRAAGPVSKDCRWFLIFFQHYKQVLLLWFRTNIDFLVGLFKKLYGGTRRYVTPMDLSKSGKLGDMFRCK